MPGDGIIAGEGNGDGSIALPFSSFSFSNDDGTLWVLPKRRWKLEEETDDMSL